MKITKTLWIAISLIAINALLKAQDTFNPPTYTNSQINPCGVHNKHIGDRRPINYTSLRESDVAWEKRVWRDIDMREKQNQPLYYPLEYNACRSSLFQTITRQILNGNIIAFKDEEFLIPYEPSEFRKKIVKTDTVDQSIYDELGNERIVRVAVSDSTSIYERILKFRVKEDWYFDKQKSSLEVRIVGLAAFEYNAERDYFREVYWVYFPSCRPYFARNDVYNFKNDSERRSLDDIFWKRQFSSIIVKESNVQDRYIDQYQKGIDALVEADKIKMNIFTWEHDLWNY
ncbi:MAG: gliding motility protein GldN [Bacteroidia bacterium]|nr:gliding motility protein GldN [Bacteroidia bacterium]